MSFLQNKFSGMKVLIALVAVSLSGCVKEPVEITPQSGQSNLKSGLLTTAAGGKYIPGQYIIVLKEGVTDVDREADDMEKKYGGKEEHRYRSAIKGFSGKYSKTEINALLADPKVAYIEQDQEAHIVLTQSPATWGLDRVDQQYLPLNNSYSYTQTGAGVYAYIIDTGILTTHSDFGGRAVPGFDAITIGGTAVDGNGHGTHVAGTIGGSTYGLAKNVNLVAVRVLDNNGSGSFSQVIAGIDWVTANHKNPAVANMSLGGGASTTLDAAVRNSILAGVTYCIAAGNSAANAGNYSPARVTEAITVGATDNTDKFASFSNYGSVVDLSAPGVSITSDWFTSVTATNTISGTSMATPHTAGAVALYLEANSTATPAQVQTALKANATPGRITSLPTGTANLLLFVGIPVPVTIPPVPVMSSPANAATGVSVSPTLVWNASAGATSYNLLVTKGGVTVYSYAGLTTTSKAITGLTNSTTYNWQVSATNSAGTSALSSAWSFTTAAVTAPAAPVLSSPASNATRVRIPVTLSWKASTGATSYEAQVSTGNTFTSLAFSKSGIVTTSTATTGLSSGITYYWRVRAVNTAGPGVWSAVRSFKTR
jgi:subtilisin family serine protease